MLPIQRQRSGVGQDITQKPNPDHTGSQYREQFANDPFAGPSLVRIKTTAPEQHFLTHICVYTGIREIKGRDPGKQDQDEPGEQDAAGHHIPQHIDIFTPPDVVDTTHGNAHEHMNHTNRSDQVSSVLVSFTGLSQRGLSKICDPNQLPNIVPEHGRYPAVQDQFRILLLIIVQRQSFHGEQGTEGHN